MIGWLSTGLDRWRLAAKPRSAATIAAALTRSLQIALFIAVFAIGTPIIAASPAATPKATFEALGFLPDSTNSGSWATGVSSDGTVVVGYGNVGSTSNTEGFSWKSGKMKTLGFQKGDTNSKAYSTNSNGTVIVGYSSKSRQWDSHHLDQRDRNGPPAADKSKCR